jgi:hypothetical protein
MEEIETVTRQFLDTRKVPTMNITDAIQSEILTGQTLLHVWQTITESHQPLDHERSDQLLHEISELWISIRAHAFAQGWSEKFQRDFKKGTRKTLKRKGTDKEA